MYIGCHYNRDNTQTYKVDYSAASTAANFYAVSASAAWIHVKSKLNFSVEMPIEYLNFNFGGETRVFTLNQL